MIAKQLLFIILICTGPATLVAQPTTLREALSNKDTIAALDFIKKGANVNEVDNNGTSPLMNFCRWGDDTAVSFLLRHGATPDNPKSAKGRTPLLIACAYWAGHTVCGLLIEKGANVNAVAQDGSTALMLAAQNAKLDVVELLLKNGANANAKDNTGKTALDYVPKEVPDYMQKSMKNSRVDKDAVVLALQKAMK